MSDGSQPMAGECAVAPETPTALDHRQGAPRGYAVARRAWGLVAMLFAFMLINFLDKAVLGLAAVPIMKELRITHFQFGLMASSFFYLFSLSSILVGLLANRVPAKWILFAMALLWSFSQAPMIAPVGLIGLTASRIALGAGEGPAYPMAVHALHKWFPDARRTLPAAIVGQGANIGIVLILPLLNAILIRYSWHAAFGALAVASLAWAVVWLFVGREGAADRADGRSTPAGGVRVPYRRLLLNRTTLGGWAASFGAYWALALMISWFTPYVIQVLGASQSLAGVLSALPWGASIIATLGGAALSEHLGRRGVSSRWARGALAGGAVATGGVLLMALPLVPTPLKLVFLVLGLSLPALVYSLGTAISGEIAPPAQRGALLGIGSAVATSAGLIAPVLMGRLIDTGATTAAGYQTGFVLNGAVAVVGGLLGIVLIDPGRTKAWLQGAPQAA